MVALSHPGVMGYGIPDLELQERTWADRKAERVRIPSTPPSQETDRPSCVVNSSPVVAEANQPFPWGDFGLRVCQPGIGQQGRSSIKECRRCGVAKPLASFHRQAASSDGYRLECKTCGNARRRDLRKRIGVPPPTLRAKEKLRLRPYGISGCYVTRMRIEQNDQCAICGRRPSGRQHAVDHNHETGKVRGLLCGTCNSGIGLLRESPEILSAAISYLASF